MKKKILLFMLTCISVFAFRVLSVSAETGTKYGDYLYYKVSNSEVSITDCNEYRISGTVVIPKTIDGYPVTSIGNSAFSGCSRITGIAIPDSITSIGDSAFEFCSELTSIAIPNSVTSIGDQAFFGCSSLTSITIPNRDCDTIGLNQ